MTPIVGVWYGEFGWELACWQGYLRKLSKNRPVHVICPYGHEALYRDFAKHVEPHTLRGDRDCWRVRGNEAEQVIFFEQVKKYAESVDGEVLYARGPLPLSEQTFIRFGISSNIKAEDRFDILLHARERKVRGVERNTDIAQVMTLISLLPPLRIASIGSYHEAKHVPGTTDLRGILLENLMDHMAAAGVVVGPASGPSVLALLCGAPGVAWSDTRWYSSVNADNKRRLTELWNPFKTPVTVLQQSGFNPYPTASVKAIQETIRACRI